jgi:hypothetical protein
MAWMITTCILILLNIFLYVGDVPLDLSIGVDGKTILDY